MIESGDFLRICMAAVPRLARVPSSGDRPGHAHTRPGPLETLETNRADCVDLGLE